MAGRGRPTAGASGEILHSFAPAVYFALILLIAVPAVDFLLNVWPLQFGELGWRYGAVGLFAQYLHTPLLGFLLLTLFAAWRGDVRTLRVAGIVCLAGALLMILANVGFALDALQLRAGVADEARTVFHVAVIRAFAKMTTAAIAFVLLGLAAVRVARRLKQATPGAPRAARPPLREAV